MQLRRLLATSAVAVATVTSLAACGDEETTQGRDEGTYVTAGDLQYQVQISRQLNPTDFEDRDYLTGLPSGAALGVNQEYFAVFLRVWNRTKIDHETASRFEISDTTGKTYQPIAIDTNINRTAYHAVVIHGGDQIPVPGSLARENLTQGGLVLFKVENSTYASRPLVLHITSPEGKSATVDLDV
ncbi:MAG TPA: hypothetical protein VFG42_12440 [Baekduia sp.]|uniref:hypothetical protein n=1 Tax=Baekduia sp. TaxID=2600305 RepID=UPI002D77C44A|nr:hypothetical protein [Baekduia sp.]HET6507589.1 hypothetical protein [Baekduia sp.]